MRRSQISRQCAAILDGQLILARALSGLLVVWFYRMRAKGLKVPLPERPWYVQKETLNLADLVRAAQETLRGMDVQGWAVGILENDPNIFKKAMEQKKRGNFAAPKPRKWPRQHKPI